MHKPSPPSWRYKGRFKFPSFPHHLAEQWLSTMTSVTINIENQIVVSTHNATLKLKLAPCTLRETQRVDADHNLTFHLFRPFRN